MIRRPIKSDPSPDSPRPWAEIDCTDGSLRITVRALNGLRALREQMAARGERGLTATQRTALVNAEKPGSRTLSLSADKPTETHVLAQTLEGTLSFVPESELAPVYYAHLAFYAPGSKVWTVLEFGR